MPGEYKYLSLIIFPLLTSASSISDGDEMNFVLLTLVEYLGHTNPLISGLAYDEVVLHLSQSIAIADRTRFKQFLIIRPSPL